MAAFNFEQSEANNIDPKFAIEYTLESAIWLERDHAEGPAVGFIYEEDTETAQLIILEHTFVAYPYGEGKYQPFMCAEPDHLMYTPDEWVAFYGAAKGGEFQALYNNPEGAYLRDSKVPDGHFFVFTVDGFRPFIDAVIAGKYDLNPTQESQIRERFV